jgi:hypothetical protein
VSPALSRHAAGLDEAPGARIKALDAKDTSRYNTIRYVAQPTLLTPTCAAFRLGGPEGIKLEPGQQILLEIPKHLRGRPVYQAIMEHRQVASEKSSALGGGEKPWDHTPGLTALHFSVVSESKGQSWRYWHAPWGSSGAEGGKYAELRPDWESESHFDFAKNGTVAVEGGDLHKEVICIDGLRLRGVGKDPTFIRQVLVTFAPPKPDHVEEHCFTPKTKIGDLLTTKGQNLAKDREKGTFPGALVLYDGGADAGGASPLPAGWLHEAGQLRVPLRVGVYLAGVELACGDTKPDGLPNSDGDIGTQGHSKLRIGLLRAGAAEPEWLMEDHGVPPQGVLFAGPSKHKRLEAEDQLVLGASVDPTYVMALRLSYRDEPW